MTHRKSFISFEVTKEEAETISLIVERATQIARRFDIAHRLQPFTLALDVTACHANGCRLRLRELYEADTSNFIHDVFGIATHINRETGQLENCFTPRYAE